MANYSDHKMVLRARSAAEKFLGLTFSAVPE